MSEIVESNEQGDVVVPHTVIAHPHPHQRYRVDVEGNTLKLVPMGEEPYWAAASIDEWAASFLKWVNSPRPAAPLLDDEATRRESMYE